MAGTSPEAKRKSRIRVSIKEGDRSIKEFEGRFLGFIDDDESKWVVNKKEVAHKAFTSQTVPIDNSYNAVGKRALIATTTYYEQYSRSLFMTPVVKYAIKADGKLIITCRDDKEYVLEELVK